MFTFMLKVHENKHVVDFVDNLCKQVNASRTTLFFSACPYTRFEEPSAFSPVLPSRRLEVDTASHTQVKNIHPSQEKKKSCSSHAA